MNFKIQSTSQKNLATLFFRQKHTKSSNRHTPTLNTLSTDAILREIINATKKNFVKFYISAIYNQTLAALFWHTCAKNHEMCATKRPVLHLLSLVVYLFPDATHLHY